MICTTGNKAWWIFSGFFCAFLAPKLVELIVAQKRVIKEHSKVIRCNRLEHWENLQNALNTGIWSLGYKTIMKKIRWLSSRHIQHRANEDYRIPDYPIKEERRNEILNAEIRLFITEELCDDTNTLKNRKALGPYGVPAEVLKAVCCRDIST